MESKNKKNICEIKIKYDGETWQEAIKKSFEKNKKDVKVNGFRPGKVPYEIFIKNFGIESLFSDAIDSLIDKAYNEALEKSSIVPVVKPGVEISSISSEEIEYNFTFIGKPEVNIKKYKGLKVEKDKVEVSEEEINEEINHLLEHYAELVIKDGKVENNDTVIIDYEGFTDGVAFDGGKDENYSLVIGSNTFIPGFEEQLIGMEKEEEKDIEVVFPEDYHAQELKGKKATFKVKVHEIKTKQNRELDEEFFEDLEMEGVNSLETLKESIKDHLESHKKVDVENKFVDDMLDAISENTEVEIPDEMIEEEIDGLMYNFEERLKYQGISLDLFYEMTRKTEESLRDEMRDEANKNVLYRLIMNEIINKEEIEVSDEEVEEEVSKLAKQYHATEEKVKEEISFDEIKYSCKVQKTLNKLEEYNKVK